MLSALLPGMVAGLGVAVIIATLVPTQPRLSAAIAKLNMSDEALTATSSAQLDYRARIGAWVHSVLPDLRGFTIPEKDLALLGMPVNTYLFNKARNAAAFLVLPTLIGIEIQILGFVPFYIPALFGPLLAIVGWIAPDIAIRQQAATAREDFSRSVAIYLELVATKRIRGGAPEMSLIEAAAVGRSWVFVRIGEELTRSRYAGLQPWDGLTRFADEISVPELVDVANIMRRSGEDGASVYQSLRQRGRSLRVQLLNVEQTRANKISQMLSVPMTGLVGVFVGIVITALLLNLLNS